MRSRTFTISLALVVASTGALLGVRRHRERFTYYLSPHDPQLSATLAGTGYVEDTLETTGGVQLRGMLRQPAAATDPWLVLFPGNAQRQLAPGLPIVEGIRAGRPAGVAVYAYRGFEGSTGRPSPEASAQDARAIIEHLKARFGMRTADLRVVGYSMGSGIALRLTADLTEAGTPPKALALLSPYTALELAPARPLHPLWPTETYQVADSIPKVRQPVLIVGAAKDGALPVTEHARPLAAAFGARAQYRELSEANHHDYLEDKAVLQNIGDFLWSAP
ncbi:MAG: hypothetical protein ABW321_13280 [Polyangiales bacterium]